MPSIIIPACNEQNVIGRCLSALLDDARPGELEVIVVCNGCNDRTADVARRFGQDVRVIETPVGSKARALNLGDQSATRYPRFYVDADVVLTTDAMRELQARLRNGKLAVAPRASFDLSGCSWFVRAFYEINDRLPSSHEGIGGSGAYALSRLGRRRFDRFPEIIADDGFVRVQFSRRERETVRDCHSLVSPPRRLRELIQIKTRSHLGTAQLRRLYPHVWHHRGTSNGPMLLRLFARPALWPKLVVYCCVKSLARLRAGRKMRARDWSWERDDSSRARHADSPTSAAVPEVDPCPTS